MCPVLLVPHHSAELVECLPIDKKSHSYLHVTTSENRGVSQSWLNVRIQTHVVVICITLCCRMASRALNSKGRDCVCDASWGARSRTNQRSRPRPRKSNTNRDWGVTIAFKAWKKRRGGGQLDANNGTFHFIILYIKKKNILLSAAPIADSVNICSESSDQWRSCRYEIKHAEVHFCLHSKVSVR